MADINKIITNMDAESPQLADREFDLQDWDEAQAQRNAEQEGIEMSAPHWEVVNFLREHYLKHGPAKSGRELSDVLDRQFADQGGRKHLRRLFPEGPVTQGMRIAGLPLPPNTEDEGFGVSR
ncbi:MAG: TusE/DsrC/DsvC family sulfur relay protein [Gammaproteobacteria bacterium]|jgi:tRNA 2-thiouridine synthesizing protein E